MKASIKFTMLLLATMMIISACEKEEEIVNLNEPNFLITDTAFFNCLIDEGIDIDNSGSIDEAEAEAVTELFIITEGIGGAYGIGCYGTGSVTDLTGLEKFINLTALSFGCQPVGKIDLSPFNKLNFFECKNADLQTIDVSDNPELETLKCANNQLSSLDITNNPELGRLYCWGNPLTSLDISNNLKLFDLWCNGIEITSLDISNNPALEALKCGENQLTNLDLSNNPALWDLQCRENQLTNLDISNNTALRSLDCSDNEISSLDVSKNTELEALSCGGNKITELDLTNNNKLSWLHLENMPTLTKVCVWTMPFPPGGFDLDTTGSPNIQFTTACSR